MNTHIPLDHMPAVEIKAARKACGYTRQESADYLGISLKHWNALERGAVNPTRSQENWIGKMAHMSSPYVMTQAKLMAGIIEKFNRLNEHNKNKCILLLTEDKS